MRSAALGLLPGRVVVKLRPGEAPAAPAAALDVRAGLAEPERRTGLAAVDRVLARHSDAVGVTRLHAAARSVHRPGHRNEDFDDLEHVLGLSRTFVIDLDRRAPLERVAEALNNLYEVESAAPQLLCVTPFLRVRQGATLVFRRPDDDARGVLLLTRGPALPSSSSLRAPPPTRRNAQAAPWRTLMSGRPDRSRAAILAADALAVEQGLPSTTVAVLDTGVAPGRPWFGNNLLRGFDTVALGTGDLSSGLELLGDTSDVDLDPDDEVGHGTGTAGIISAAGGQAVPAGLAGACTVIPVRVLGSVRRTGHDARFGVGSPVDIDAGLKRAVDLGAKVLNLSFGTPLAAVPEGAPVPHEDVVRYASARGCVLVAASGNSGREEAYTPAALPGVIAVGAVDQDGAPAAFSTSGPHVDLCAPGKGVLTTGLDGPVCVDGTSFAAPFVTAAAALLVSLAARRSHPLDGPGVAEVLRSTSRPWPSTSITGHGAGVLDVPAALAALDRSLDRLSPPPGGRWSHHHDGTSLGRT